MKARLILMICSIFISVAYADAVPTDTVPPPAKKTNPLASNCNPGEEPTVVRPMENWEIIAHNTSNMATSRTFKGNKLIYAIAANPSDPENSVTIDSDTGMITVKAEKKDKFDITVKATNLCGEASNTFNVIIDEEE